MYLEVQENVLHWVCTQGCPKMVISPRFLEYTVPQQGLTQPLYFWDYDCIWVHVGPQLSSFQLVKPNFLLVAQRSKFYPLMPRPEFITKRSGSTIHLGKSSTSAPNLDGRWSRNSLQGQVFDSPQLQEVAWVPCDGIPGSKPWDMVVSTRGSLGNLICREEDGLSSHMNMSRLPISWTIGFHVVQDLYEVMSKFT